MQRALPHVATRLLDFRKAMEGLAAVVKKHLRVDAFTGAIVVFRADQGTGLGRWNPCKSPIPDCRNQLHRLYD